MSDNCILVSLHCKEIVAHPIMKILIDLDKVTDANDVRIDVGREELAQLGEMATWYHT